MLLSGIGFTVNISTSLYISFVKVIEYGFRTFPIFSVILKCTVLMYLNKNLFYEVEKLKTRKFNEIKCLLIIFFVLYIIILLLSTFSSSCNKY